MNLVFWALATVNIWIVFVAMSNKKLSLSNIFNLGAALGFFAILVARLVK